MALYIIGFSGFLGQNTFFRLKKDLDTPVFGISHDGLQYLKKIKKEDIVINFCGLNRAGSRAEYLSANLGFTKKLSTILKKHGEPLLIHISSILVHGFESGELPGSKEHNDFIGSKRAAEEYLRGNYREERLCIIRPTNIIAYNAIPYYNNILVSIIKDKISGEKRINWVNRNSYRDFITFDEFVENLKIIVVSRKVGTFDITSTNSISLLSLLSKIYQDIPDHIAVMDGSPSRILVRKDSINTGGTLLCCSLTDKTLADLESKMSAYQRLEDIAFRKLPVLRQERGEMVEISSLKSSRSYKITINPGKVRGNHYHFEQNEDFFVNQGQVFFILAHPDHPEILKFLNLRKNESVSINPMTIHTLVNPSPYEPAEIFILSTQSYVQDQSPDTEYFELI